MATMRLTYEQSCRRLQELVCLDAGDIPPVPDHVPQSDDEGPLGVNFFRTFIGEGADLQNLTLPRTFFGRSEIRDTLWCNTDLTESNLCWNDFIDVDFTHAVLVRADLRCSPFQSVKFVGADLRGADMRRSSFDNCVFDGALMEGAILTRNQGAQIKLSSAQRAEIDWREDDGPEPSGG
jgi:uncharacterized protein YjbI with pentapeptide repeats